MIEGHHNTSGSEDLRRRLRWLLFGRVLIISAFLGALSLVTLSGRYSPYVVSINLLFGIIAATYAVAIASAVALQRLHDLRGFSHGQVGFDVLLTTGVLYLTGGPDSPFAFLYTLPIINAAILLFSQGAVATAVMATAAYTGLVAGMLAGVVPTPDYQFPPAVFDGQLAIRMATNNGTFFLIAILATSLTRRLHETEQLLLEREGERDKLAVLQEALARNIGSGLVTTDANGRITSANEIAEALVGGEPGRLREKDLGELFPPLNLTATARTAFLQSTSPLQPTEFTHRCGDEREVKVRCMAAPLRDTYGHAIGALYILQDVTSLQDLAQELEGEQAGEMLAREAGEEMVEEAAPRDGLLGTSPAMRQVHELIDKVARSDATILVTGESGTGKELVARAIHARSNRTDRPFVALNCGAIPENLIESELFGHVKGAFTGAVGNRAGYFRMADGGTIFLDEIGELPLALQVKLLRVLQERVFIPVGGQSAVAVNVRVIAATNRDLATDIKAGRFREDLYYRLNVITIDLPPLRERRQDVPLLIRHFLRQFSDLHGKRVTRLTVGAAKLLLAYAFPGNVRELENIIEHAVALSDSETAHEEHMPAYLLSGNGQLQPMTRPPEPRAAPAPAPTPLVEGRFDLDRDLATFEKAALLRALEQAGGVKKRAAELLGINYRSLRHRLQKYGLETGNDFPN
ncbi:MAG: sigma 54-interacting transcriptional regulator [Deltaproteobacteria bacterium]|nr:sigma 54-interacting transcriptional regulator [Deltaproteobacteria bacterium]